MFDPQRLLGALVREGMSSRRRGRRVPVAGLSSLVPGGLKGAVGLGIVGVAVAAFDHFMEKSRQPSPSGAEMPPGGYPAPPPPPPSPDPRAMLLVRAMVAAANADGRIDEQEKHAILSRMSALGLSAEDRAFVAHELEVPAGIEALLARVDSPDLARQVFAVSLLAIDVDTPAESAYLNYLQQRLGLDDETVRRIQEELSR
jgi:uncharacterized membrane protein YebE (DUF533 family)